MLLLSCVITRTCRLLTPTRDLCFFPPPHLWCARGGVKDTLLCHSFVCIQWLQKYSSTICRVCNCTSFAWEMVWMQWDMLSYIHEHCPCSHVFHIEEFFCNQQLRVHFIYLTTYTSYVLLYSQFSSIDLKTAQHFLWPPLHHSILYVFYCSRALETFQSMLVCTKY